MKKFTAILVSIAITLFLTGCAHHIAQPQNLQQTAFNRALEENTQQCKISIEKSNIPTIRHHIFWTAGLSKPTEAMQSNESFILENEKPEIAKLHQLVEFCQTMHSKTITSFINAEYGERFQAHLRSKQNNLNELSDGAINYGEYNRKEMELGRQLAADLQFLDEKYRPEIRRQSATTTEVFTPASGSIRSARDSAFVMQTLLIELIWFLPKLVL